MRRLLLGATVALVAAALTVPAQAGSPQQATSPSAADNSTSSSGEYVVLYAKGASSDAAHAAVKAAGGTIVSENGAVGLATVKTANANFLKAVSGQPALLSAMADRPIGQIPGGKSQPKRDRVENDRTVNAVAGATANAAKAGNGKGGSSHSPANEPFADKQWDMRQIDATPSGSYRVNQGSSQVLVGVIDSGIDGNHPDIQPNFSRKLSRNFTVDLPSIDGPCEQASCVDPVDADDNGHGTHVAGTIGAALNGLGMAGVAPKVTLVNLRAGQDSGFVFLSPVVSALTYAGTVGIDVVNMSFFIDPWLYNCLDNPSDSPQEQQEQRTVREATQRALDFARAHGVTPVAALGNESTDISNPTVDDTSPDFPVGGERHRTVDNSCITVPTESDGVIGISSLGLSGRKAFYSNWGTEQTDLSAPGGDSREGFGTPAFNIAENRILSTMPLSVAQASGVLNPDGTPRTPLVLRGCKGTTCAYYEYLQGTSQAAPHATGVAALIVSRFGHKDHQHGGLGLDPRTTERILRETATRTPCPVPALFDYPDPNSVDALCEGTIDHNGFYGDGIVNAFSASIG